MVAIRHSDQGDGTEPGHAVLDLSKCWRGAQLDVESLLDRVHGGPRGSENLECRQAEPLRFVLDEHSTGAKAGDGPERRLMKAGKPLMELAHRSSVFGLLAGIKQWVGEHLDRHDHPTCQPPSMTMDCPVT